MKRGPISDDPPSIQTPERVVAAWWDSLSREVRAQIAAYLGIDMDGPTEEWEDLSPTLHQMWIHMAYDRISSKTLDFWRGSPHNR